jgi:hypothetical protein
MALDRHSPCIMDRHRAEWQLKEIEMDRTRKLIPIAAMAYALAASAAHAATGMIAASPNPCEIAPGAHDCTTYVTWSTQGAERARVYVRIDGKGGTPEKEFGNERRCDRCGASWIEAGARYTFTLVDFSTGARGGELASVTVTAVKHGDARAVLTASPNPCRIAPGKLNCATTLNWSTEGVEHARVFVTAEGNKPSPEKEFGNARACDNCGANWIEAGTRYLFTLYDFTSGSRGRELASVTVTAIK